MGLSKNSWLFGDPVSGSGAAEPLSNRSGNADKLMAKLAAARDAGQVNVRCRAITLCYEVGYDAVLVGSVLRRRGIECLVIDPGSLQVNRRRDELRPIESTSRCSTNADRWCRGERHVCRWLRIPVSDEEDFAALAS